MFELLVSKHRHLRRVSQKLKGLIWESRWEGQQTAEDFHVLRVDSLYILCLSAEIFPQPIEAMISFLKMNTDL